MLPFRWVLIRKPVAFLTLLHVDLNESMLTDMKEVTLVNSDPLNQVPAVQIRGVQNDGVTWDCVAQQ